MIRKRPLALLIGAIPFVGLVLALPLVNRIHPFVLGMPFLLAWIVGWVALSPILLWLAERLWNADNRRSRGGKSPLRETPGAAGGGPGPSADAQKAGSA